MKKDLFPYWPLLLSILVLAIFGQISLGYFSAISQIDLTSGDLADWMTPSSLSQSINGKDHP